MNATFVTTLSTEELKEIIEQSVKKAFTENPKKISSEEDEWLHTDEAAALIRYKETSVYGLVKRKKIPFCKVEGKLLFSKRKLLDWIASKDTVSKGEESLLQK